MERISDYREDHAPLVRSIVCDQYECFLRAVVKCRTCGDSICDSHAQRCEEKECSGYEYCQTCAGLVDDVVLCHKHEMQYVMRQEEM